jgi:hypothetical protein
MKSRIIGAFAAIIYALSPMSVQAETLNNQSIIVLSRVGLGSPAIIAKIRTSATTFDLSTESLVALKQARVADDVIAAMLEASTQTTVSASAAASASNMSDPKTPHPSGIYVHSEWETAPRLMRLDPTTSAESKSTGRLASALTYGIARVRSKTVLSTAAARLQLPATRPAFYFYFDQTTSSLSQGGGSSNPWAAITQQGQPPVTSPNEFALVRLRLVGTSREIEVGSANIMGGSSGVAAVQRIDFTYEDVAPGIFKVTPLADLTPGEYGFVYSSGGNSGLMAMYMGGGGSTKVFDFGIRAATQ